MNLAFHLTTELTGEVRMFVFLSTCFNILGCWAKCSQSKNRETVARSLFQLCVTLHMQSNYSDLQDSLQVSVCVCVFVCFFFRLRPVAFSDIAN